MSKVLTRKDVLDADDLEKLLVKNVPIWKADIWIRMMSSGERMEFELAKVDANGDPDMKKLGNYFGEVVAATALEADGTRMFPGPNDAALVSKKNALAVQYVAEKSIEFNKLSAASQEEAAKN